MNYLCNRRLLLSAAVVILSLAPRASSLLAQESRPIFSSSVAVVPITAVVRDSRNRIVRSLGKGDFQVLENDQARPIVDFNATDHSPLSLAVLVDTSGSMRGSNFDKSKRVVDRLLQEMDPGTDEAALFTFDKSIRQEAAFGSHPDIIRTALDRTDAWGLTSLYDAIADTAKQLGDRRRPRRAVVVITDGVDTSSTLTPADVSGLASAIDVPVYVIAVVPRDRPLGNPAPDGDSLSNLASWTGGDLRHVPSPAQLDETVRALMAELRQQYFIAIESAAGSAWYRLDVKTRHKDLTVRARGGYFAAASPRPAGD